MKRRRIPAPQKPRAPEAGANIPVGAESVLEAFAAAKEIHQHNSIKHLVVCVHDNESHELLCLHCGRSAVVKPAYSSEVDATGLQLFKQFHISCAAPKNPLGFFNADDNAPKQNPRFKNPSGVEVEVTKIRVNRRTRVEHYDFFDIAEPKSTLTMPKEKFLELFSPVGA
jgi:hypothetical protein